MPDYSFFKQAFDDLATNGFIGDPNGLPAYCYIRVSTDEQADEGRSGLPRQIAHCHEVALRQGYKIPWDLVFADDYTGFKFKRRPALSVLRKEFKRQERRAQAVVMEHLDRLSRNADWHQGFLLEEMEEHNIMPVFWKSFASRIERAVQGAIAQEGMEQSLERMKQGNYNKAAKEGRVTAKKRAYGMRFVDSQGNEGERARKDTHYAFHEEEKAVVQEMYRRVAKKGAKANALAQEFNDRKIKPPAKMSYWTASLIAGIIRNPLYKGEFYANRYKVIKGEYTDEYGREHRIYRNSIRPRDEWVLVRVPAIVDEATWELAQQMLKKNKEGAKRNARDPFLLTSLVKCACCGRSYVGAQRTQTHQWKSDPQRQTTYKALHYRCISGNKGRHIRTAIGCTNASIKCDVLDAAVWKAVYTTLRQPEYLNGALDRVAAESDNQELLNEIAYLDRQIAAAPAQDERLITAYKVGAFDEFELAAQRKAIKAQVAQWQAARAEKITKVVTPAQIAARKQRVLDAVSAAQDLREDAPFEDKQYVLRVYVDRVIVDVRAGCFALDGVIRAFSVLVQLRKHLPSNLFTM
jgi:site-specific DNA recombinase